MGGAVKGVVKGVKNTIKGVAHGDMKSILTVAAAVGAYWAVPQIGSAVGMSAGTATSLGLSTETAAAINGAIGGALYGGATTAILGGNPLKGGLLGAAGGALSGYLSPGKFIASAAPAEAAAATALSGLEEAAPTGLDAATATPTAAAPTGAQLGLDASGWNPSISGDPYSLSTPMPGDNWGNIGLGDRLSSSGVGFNASNLGGVPGSQLSVSAPMSVDNWANAGLGEGLSYGNTTAVNAANMGLHIPAGWGIPEGTVLGTADAASTAATAATEAAKKAPEFSWAGIKNGFAQIGDGKLGTGIGTVWDSLGKGGQQAAIVGGGLLAASALGKGFTAPNVASAQANYLKDLNEYQKDAYNNKKNAAYDLAGESAYYDPHYFGQQAQNQRLIEGTTAKNNALREMAGQGRSYAADAEARRFNLGTALNASAAYTAGADAAQNQRVRTKAAGYGLLPNAPADISASYGGLYETTTAPSKSYFNLFNTIYGTAKSTSDDKEKKDAALNYAV